MRRFVQSLCVAVVAIATACATNPATGKKQLMLMSEAQEIQLGKESDQQVRQEMGVYNNADLQNYVASVGAKLKQKAHRPNLPWTYTVVDAPAVNAFALPGGFIYITRGILPFLRDDAELAAVMGHETGHVDARHSAAAYSTQTVLGGALAVGSVLSSKVGAVSGAASQALGLAFLKNSRDAELEADRLGVGYASQNGWAPEGMTDLLNTLGRLDEASGSSRGVPNWALTHPPAADRVAKVQESVAQARAATGAGTRSTEELDKRLDGLVFGDSREQGMVRNGEFVHPVLRFGVKFPSNWEIANSAQQVVAQRDENGNVVMILQGAPAQGSPRDTAQASMTKAGFAEVEGRERSLNGDPAYVGTYRGKMENTDVGLRAAFIRHGDQTYMLAGLATADQFAGAQGAFDASIGSFRTLSQSEADGIQPNRIRFYTVKSGETWESLAQGASGGAVKPTTLAIMNGSAPNTPPKAGARIRIVSAGR
jgi:predicted Zn-dependent protease